jgi:hypothetical protein
MNGKVDCSTSLVSTEDPAKLRREKYHGTRDAYWLVVIDYLPVVISSYQDFNGDI